MADHAPISLVDLKDDLGITDDANDAWLQRAVDGVWARMEAYTSRKLCAPAAPFVDDWGLLVINGAIQPMPPPLMYPLRGSVFLRYFPVASIDAIQLNGGDGDPTKVTFDGKTGKLFGLTGFTQDLGYLLPGSRARITYKAGWAAVPMDLYMVALGAMQVLWGDRQAQGGGGIGRIGKLDVMDVGSLEIATANPFVEATFKTPGVAADPLLGPWLSMLDIYIDHRSLIGSATMATTTPGPLVVNPLADPAP